MDALIYHINDPDPQGIQKIIAKNPTFDPESGNVTIFKPQVNPEKESLPFESTTIKLTGRVIADQQMVLERQKNELKGANVNLGAQLFVQERKVDDLTNPEEYRDGGKIALVTAILALIIGPAILTGGFSLPVSLTIGLIFGVGALLLGAMGVYSFKTADETQQEIDTLSQMKQKKGAVDFEMKYYNEQLSIWQKASTLLPTVDHPHYRRPQSPEQLDR